MPSQHGLLRLLREAITWDESVDLDVSEADSVVPDRRVEAAVPPSAAATHEPAQADLEPKMSVPAIEIGVLEQPAAARLTSASFLTEITPLRDSQDRREASSARSSGSRQAPAPRGMFTTVRRQ